MKNNRKLKVFDERVINKRIRARTWFDKHEANRMRFFCVRLKMTKRNRIGSARMRSNT